MSGYGEAVTDPELLRELNAGSAGTSAASPHEAYGKPVTDPELLRQLNGPSSPSAPVTRPHPAIIGPVYGSHLSPEDQAIAEKIAARKTFASSLMQGFTFGFGDEIKAGVEAIPSAIARGSNPANEYHRILNVQREAQRMYENQNPTGAGVAEFAGAMANPLSRAISGPVATVGEKAGSYVASKAPAWAAKGAGWLGRVGTEAALHGAAYEGAKRLGEAENISPSQYVPTAASGAIEGAEWGPVGAIGLAGLVKGGAHGWEKIGKPIAGAAGTALSKVTPGPVSRYLESKSENIAKEGAVKKIYESLDEINNTVNERLAANGVGPIDILDEMKRKALPPIPQGVRNGIKNTDHAESVINNIDAVSKLPTTPGRYGLTDKRKDSLIETIISQRLSPERRIEKVKSSPFINDEQKEKITSAMMDNPIGENDRVNLTEAKSYFNDFKNNKKIPTNIIDESAALTAEFGSKGAEDPMNKLARIAGGAGGAEKSTLAAELGQRQAEQPIRMARHIEDAARMAGPKGDFQNLGQAKDAAEHLVSTVADEAYSKIREDRSPINLEHILAKWTREKNGMGDSDARRSISDAISRLGTVHHDETPPLNPLTALFQGHKYQSDIDRFLDVRNNINTAITKSKVNGEPTYTTKVLNSLLNDVNEAARAAHPSLSKIDATYKEGKTIDKIIDTAYSASEKLNHTAGPTIKYFDSLTPEQKDLFRMSFAEKLKDIVASRPENSAFVGGKFQNKATRDMINHIFGKEQGRILNEKIMNESVTTRTLHHTFGGSQTTPWAEAIKQFRLGAEFPVEVLMNPVGHGMRHAAVNLLKYNISNRQASHIGKMIANSDPVQKLKVINMLKQYREQAANAPTRRNAFAQKVGTRLGPIAIQSHQVGVRPEEQNAE
jgi:hypothetical protein